MSVSCFSLVSGVGLKVDCMSVETVKSHISWSTPELQKKHSNLLRISHLCQDYQDIGFIIKKKRNLRLCLEKKAEFKRKFPLSAPGHSIESMSYDVHAAEMTSCEKKKKRERRTSERSRLPAWLRWQTTGCILETEPQREERWRSRQRRDKRTRRTGRETEEGRGGGRISKTVTVPRKCLMNFCVLCAESGPLSYPSGSWFVRVN